MRKKILKWLLGSDIDTYQELLKKYETLLEMSNGICDKGATIIDGQKKILESHTALEQSLRSNLDLCDTMNMQAKAVINHSEGLIAKMQSMMNN